jgi:hypothetical protein
VHEAAVLGLAQPPGACRMLLLLLLLLLLWPPGPSCDLRFRVQS